MPRRPIGDIIVLLPGITGSVLQRDGKDVWALSGGAALRALVSLGGSIRDLALADDPPDQDDLEDGVTAPRLVPDIHIIPGLWRIDGYTKVGKAIQATFDVTPGQNYFEFAYDWRRDNRVAARRLARQSHDWLKAWRDRSGNQDAKLILVGHSMGGLVSRYFLELLDGWKDTRMLVTFGTPYRGSLNALDFIANGMRKKVGPITLVDLSDLLRSFTSVYQLLPIYPCFEDGSGELVRVTETEAIPNMQRPRAEAALKFHSEIREAVEEHLEDDAYARGRYAIHPVVGMFQPTGQSARLDGGRLEVLRAYRGEDQDGDGTVPRVSATPIELSNQQREVYVADRHGSLQNNDPVLVQLTGLVSGLDLDLSTYYAINTRLSLDIDDTFGSDEPVEVRVRSEDPSVELTATVIETEGGGVAARATLERSSEEWRTATVGPFPPGTYRLTVRGEGPVDPVTEVFMVLGQDEETMGLG
jgi:pimeloyl-ACP methyl ester carboxylesterase